MVPGTMDGGTEIGEVGYRGNNWNTLIALVVKVVGR
jgi:hypothetical protein